MTTTWQLLTLNDVLPMHYGFIPSVDETMNLECGDVVGLVVVTVPGRLLDPETDNRERIFATIVDRSEKHFTGRLHEHSKKVLALSAGATLEFLPEHVVEIVTFRNGVHRHNVAPDRVDRKFDVELRSDRLAVLTIEGPNAQFGLRGTGLREFGFSDSPHFRILDSPGPADYEWGIRIANGNNGAPNGHCEKGPVAAARVTDSTFELLEAWLEEAGMSRSAEAMQSLPPGSYYIVRVSENFALEANLLIGNSIGRAPQGMRRLSVQPRFGPHGAYARRMARYIAERKIPPMTLVGSDAGQPPNLGHPLIGMGVLDADGYRSSNLWFFSFAAPPTSITEPSTELVMTVPISGELVWSTESPPRTAQLYEQWRDRDLPICLEYLLGEEVP